MTLFFSVTQPGHIIKPANQVIPVNPVNPFVQSVQMNMIGRIMNTNVRCAHCPKK
jgi:hypothetical protein